MRRLSIFTLPLLWALVGLVLVAPAPGVGAAVPLTNVLVQGHGDGHGRGMGQYGALGYSLAGWSYANILAHYYPGTTLSTQPAASADPSIRVILMENDNQPIAITSDSSFTVAGHIFTAGQVARLVETATGIWELEAGTSCLGPWSPLFGGLSESQTIAVPASLAPNAPPSEVLDLCLGSGERPYRGTISAADYLGNPRTINTLAMDEYLDGVVPSEMPNIWGGVGAAGPQGEPWGFQALEAQAVAARSYALSVMNQYGFADICDSQLCQVYGGMQAEGDMTDVAVSATSGQVVELGGEPAETEYSASTGGWTAAGQFPAVVDAGDSVCVSATVCNPYHNWSEVISAASIAAVWPAVGQLESIDITARDGTGGPASTSWGGRVVTLELVGSATTLSLTGATFAGALGLPSDWINLSPTTAAPSSSLPSPAPSPVGNQGPTPSPQSSTSAAENAPGYLVATASGRVLGYGSAAPLGSFDAARLGEPIVGIAADRAGGYWLAGTGGEVFAVGGAPNLGSAKVPAGVSVVAISATPDGKGYWVALSSGVVQPFGDARIFSYHGPASVLNDDGWGSFVGVAPTNDAKGMWLARSNGAVLAFGDARYLGDVPATALVHPVIAIAATPDSKGYWLLTADGRVFGLGDAHYYGSLLTAGARGARATGILPSRSGHGYDLLTKSGQVYAFGDAPALGGPGNEVALAGPALAFSAK